MKTECTELFIHYREIARLVWNLGFYAKPELREWACERAYDEAMARLFEGMILRPLGYEGHVELTFSPGKVVAFSVVANSSEVQLLVNKNPPGEPGRLWGNPIVTLGKESYHLKFIAFFDWYQLATRDFRLLEVLIERLDGRPELVGRHALIELTACSIWLSESSKVNQGVGQT